MIKNPFLKFNLCLFIFCFVLICAPVVAQAAILYLTPQSQTVYNGDSFLVEVRIDTEGEEINAVEAYLEFPENLLNAVDFIKGDSVLPLFISEPEIQNEKISFTSGAPNGFQGDGLLIKISFLGKELGEAGVAFKENSNILLNDGQGTNAKLNFLTGNYEIIKKPKGLPVITSETHPEQNKWEQSTTLSLYWDLIKDAEYSYLLSRDPLAEPDEIPDRPEGELVWIGAMKYDLKGEGDGIYYFSLLQKLSGEEWLGVSRFKVMIDSTSPEDFEPQIGQDSAVFGGKYFLSFASQDKTSGIAYYEITEISRILGNFFQKEEWIIGGSPYLLKDQKLRSIIKVKAIDRAGNERIVEVVPPYKVSWQDIAIVLLILAGIGIIWIIRKRAQKRTQNDTKFV